MHTTTYDILGYEPGRKLDEVVAVEVFGYVRKDDSVLWWIADEDGNLAPALAQVGPFRPSSNVLDALAVIHAFDEEHYEVEIYRVYNDTYGVQWEVTFTKWVEDNPCIPVITGVHESSTLEESVCKAAIMAVRGDIEWKVPALR